MLSHLSSIWTSVKYDLSRARMEENEMRHIPVHLIAQRWMVFLLLVVVLFASAVQSQVEKREVQAPSSNFSFVIRHARIFDGQQIAAADSVFIQNGKIQ